MIFNWLFSKTIHNYLLVIIFHSFLIQQIYADTLPTLEIINQNSTTQDDPKDKLIEDKFNNNYNNLIDSKDKIKIKDKSRYTKIGYNEASSFDDGMELKDNYSPILKFILEKIRPMIETRIDNFLIKAGFESNLRKSTRLESQLIMHTIQESTGVKGLRATCGQKVEISFEQKDEYKTPIDKNHKEEKIWINIGQNYLSRGLELGIIGMRIGETREIQSPYQLNIGKNEEALKLFLGKQNAIFEVTLYDIEENEKKNEISNNLKFYDVVTSLSRQITCTDKLKLTFKILNSFGEVLYTSHLPLKINIGSGYNPYLEEILMNAKNLGKRIAFVETKYLQDLKAIPFLKGIEKILDNNKAVILELSPVLITQY